MQRLPRSDARYQISKPPEGVRESAVASATRRGVPRVGLVGSAFEGSEDHDGTVIEGLPSPAPLDAELTGRQWHELVSRVMEIGGPVRGGFESAIGKNEWVLVLVEVGPARRSGNDGPAVSDPRVVQGVLTYLLRHGRGRRFTIAAALPEDTDDSQVWEARWGGVFGGLTYRDMVDQLSAGHPDVHIELTDLTSAGAIPMHTRGRPLMPGLQAGMVSVALPFQRCDSVVCVAPLRTDPRMGVSLGFGAYLGAAARSEYGVDLKGLESLGSRAESAVDIFAFRPADIVVLGGGWASEGGGRALRHNVVAAGTRAVPVEAVAAAAMGYQPEQLEQLHLAGKKGFNSEDLDGIVYYTWIRGNEIDDVKRDFQRPSAWKPYEA